MTNQRFVALSNDRLTPFLFATVSFSRNICRSIYGMSDLIVKSCMKCFKFSISDAVNQIPCGTSTSVSLSQTFGFTICEVKLSQLDENFECYAKTFNGLVYRCKCLKTKKWKRTIASAICSWVGLNGWSTTSASPIVPDGGVSSVDICTVNGIDVTLVTSWGVFGALPESADDKSFVEIKAIRWNESYSFFSS